MITVDANVIAYLYLPMNRICLALIILALGFSVHADTLVKLEISQ